MKPYTKGFILLISLLFPILIYLFLRFFGNNKYELPLIDLNKNDCIEIFQNDSISDNYYSGFIKIVDYRLSNNSIIINNLLKRLSNSKTADYIYAVISKDTLQPPGTAQNTIENSSFRC